MISCSSDDAVTQEEPQEPQNTTLRPSKISKGDKYWLFQYDEDRVTKVEEYDITNLFPRITIRFNYDATNNITSIDEVYNDGTVVPMGFTFENGLATEFNEIPYFWHPDKENQSLFFYNSQHQLTSVNFNGWHTPAPATIPVSAASFSRSYTYNSNGNLDRYELFNTNGILSDWRTYIYDDKHHPFKNIETQSRVFLKLPNISFAGTAYYDQEIFSDLYSWNVQFSNNNIVEIKNSSNNTDIAYTIIYNDEDYPIEMQPVSGHIPSIIYIEY